MEPDGQAGYGGGVAVADREVHLRHLLLLLLACGPDDAPEPPVPLVETADPDTAGADTACADTACPSTGPDPRTVDDDGDGFAEVDGDCDDADPAVHVAAEDLPGDGIDADCDNADVTSRWAGLADGSYVYELADEPVAMGATLAVGDLDGDGLAEVLAAAPGSIVLPSNWGTIHRLDGASLEVTRYWTASSGLDRFGHDLALHGDLSGDGAPDFVASDDFGRAFVLPADPQADTTLLWAADHATTEVIESDPGLPDNIAAGPDWNGDGVPELVIAVRDTSPAITDDGVAFLGLLESPYPSAATPEDLTVIAAGSYGRAVVVDLDGDGVGELAAQDLTMGDALVLFDGPALAPTASYTGDSALQPLAAGDLTGDGVEDLVIGSWVADDALLGPRAGRAMIVDRKPEGAGLDPFAEPLQVHAAGAHDWMGASAAVGDFDGDGQLDLAVGASGDPYFSDLPGRVHVWRGPITGPLHVEDAWFTAHGESPWDSFGAAVAAGDLDGDGLDDLVVGAPLWNAGAGKVYAFLGSGL